MLKNFWNKLTNPYKPEIHIGITREKIVLVNSIMLFCTLATLTYLLKYTFLENYEFSLFILFCFTIAITLLLSLRTKYAKAVMIAFGIFINLEVFIISIAAGYESGTYFQLLPLASGAFIFFEANERKKQIIFSSLSILLLTISVNKDVLGLKIEFHTNIQNPQEASVNLGIAMLANIHSIYVITKTLYKSNKTIIQQKKSISTLVENIDYSIWHIDEKFNLIQKNSAFDRTCIKLFGRIIEQGQNIFDFYKLKNSFKEVNPHNWKDNFTRAFNGEKVMIQTQISSKEETIWAEIEITPIENNGRINGALILYRDITTIKNQELKLKKSIEQNRKLSLVASSSNYGILILDTNRNIDWANPAFETTFKFQTDEIKGLNIESILSGKLTNTKINNLLNENTLNNSKHKVEIILYKKDKSPIDCTLNISTLQNTEGEIESYIIIIDDITNQKIASDQLQLLLSHSKKINQQLQNRDIKLNETIKELNKQSWDLKKSESKLLQQNGQLAQINAEFKKSTLQLLEQNETIVSKNNQLEQIKNVLALKAEELERSIKFKSEFLANMSHELRTPLNSIIILSRLLYENKDQSLTENQKEYAKVVHKSGSDLLELINDILDLSKIESGNFELEKTNCNLDAIIQENYDQFKQISIQNNIEFSVTNNVIGKVVLATDQFRLSQIIKNLLSNAFKFTKKNGLVEIIVELNNKELSISIRDNGIGIPEDKQKIIFESFKQIDGSISRKFGGTGLGLSISKELAILLGGSLQLRCSSNEGSIFTFSLPIEQIENYDNSLNQTLLLTTSIKGLIIENDPNCATILQNKILELGLQTIICNDPNNAIISINQTIPSIVIYGPSISPEIQEQINKKLEIHASNLDLIIYSITNENNDNTFKVGLQEINLIIKDLLNEKSKVALIEDSGKESVVIKTILDRNNIEYDIYTTISDVAINVYKKKYDCIILDINLPDSYGIEILNKLKENIQYNNPIIVSSGRDLNPTEIELLKEYECSYVNKSSESIVNVIEEKISFLKKLKTNNQKKQIKPNLKQKNSFAGKKILIVDDDTRNIYAIKSLFEEMEVNLITACNGKNAIEILENTSDIDLILMDVMMPEMNGYEATRIIRSKKAYKDLPIIALTAKAMEEDRINSLEAGMNEHITKPVYSTQLFSILNNLFQ